MKAIDGRPVKAAKGKLIVLQVVVVALCHLILALAVVLKAERALEEARDEQVPPLVLTPKRLQGSVLIIILHNHSTISDEH